MDNEVLKGGHGMATILAVAAVLVVVGTALGLLRRARHQVHDLQAELAEIDEVQRLLEQARARKNRSHLKLLGLIPLGWLVGSKARLAVASATSATVIGVGFTATDMPPPPAAPHTPPAAAGTVPASVTDTVPDDDYSLTPLVPSTTTSTSVAALPPAPATAAPGSASPAHAPAAAPTPDPPTTTTLLPLELPTPTTLPVELPCLNPQGIPLPVEACGSG